MKILITGGAGFIGSNLINHLALTKVINQRQIKKIVVIDNLSLGKKEFIQASIDKGLVDFYKQDLLDKQATLRVFEKYKFDLVFHLSANSDILIGSKQTDWDLKQGTLVTYNILEYMRLTQVKQIVFASTSAIYGEAGKTPIPEDYGPLLPISLYGASKLASESLISAFCHNFDLQAWIFRFGNIIGRNSTHGVLVDFIHKLKKDPTRLEVLGNGKQTKPYLHIKDCILGIITGLTRTSAQINFFNLSPMDTSSVANIAKSVIQGLNLQTTKISYQEGSRGWRGDVTQVKLDCSKLKALGWEATLTSDQAVALAIEDLLNPL